MTKRKEKLLIQEVDELTEMLRRDNEWEDLRSMIAGQGLDPQALLLAGYYEGEEGQEYACFITSGGKIIEYEGRTNATSRPAPLVWKDRSGDPL